MQRLKPMKFLVTKALVPLFTFHYAKIKTIKLDNTTNAVINLFTFHYAKIKT